MIDELVRATARSDWARARAILHTHWATTVPKVYAPSPSEPWIHSHDEAVIASELLVPIAAAFCNDPNTKEPSLSALNAEAGVGPDGRRPGQMCGRVFKNGEPTYSCRECALDPTCVLCYDCFRNSEHAKHKYRMSTSHGSGYCDCGDPEAWKSAPTCSLHEMNQDEAAAGSSLGTTIPEALQERLKGLTSLLLQYATTLVCWNHSTALPSSLISPRTDNSEPPQFLTVLFNDETHTFDAVIRALELAIHCSTNQAMLLATIVDREGRSCVRSGNQEICDRAKAEIQRRTARDVGRRTDNKNSPLEVRVMETSVVAHQSFAITLLTWLNAQTEQFPILSEVIGDVLLHAEEEPVEIDSTVASSVGANSGSSSSRSSSEPPSVVVPGSLPEESSMDEVSSLLGESFSTLDPLAITSKTLLVKMIREDRRLWKAVRSNFHQLLMKTVLMNFSQKEEFAKTFIELYEWIYHEFVNDDHEHDVSIVSLTVQFLTVPGIARRLVAKYDAIAVVSRALTNHCQEYIKKDEENAIIARYDFSQKTFPQPLKRALHMMHDQKYMLNAIPVGDEWTNELRESFVSGWRAFVGFLHHLQGMDAVRRQSVEHQVWEQEWETAFNIQLRIQENTSLLLAWAASDKIAHHRVLSLVLAAVRLHEVTVEADEVSGDRVMTVNVNGERTQCLSFCLLKGQISIHQPLWRLLAGLFAVPADFLVFLQPGMPCDDQEKELKRQLEFLGQNIYEMQLRCLVLCAQSAAQMWRRNGFSLVNQIHNYFSPLCRSEMFDRDLLMQQVGAALTEPTDFIHHLLARYRLVQWADLNFDGLGGGTVVPPPTPGGVRGSSVSSNGPLSATEQEDSSKTTVALAEELLHLIILITGERYLPGVGCCTRMEELQREVIHILCTGPQPFSQIERKIANEPLLERLNLDEAVRAVGDFKKAGSTAAGVFHLKESLRDKYNPFFYHYSKSDLSLAEQYQRKNRANASRSVIACPPPVAPPFEPFFEPARHLLRAPVVLRLVRVVLEKTLKRSRYASDRLLHRALYLIGMGLNEQNASPRSFDFLTPAENEGIFKLLEQLAAPLGSNSPPTAKPTEANAHADLLWWTIQHYKKTDASAKFGAGEKPAEVKAVDEEETGMTPKERQKALAAKKRALAMQQMMKKQTAFMEQMKKDGEETGGPSTAAPTEEEPMDTGAARSSAEPTIIRGDDDEDGISMVSNGFPVCIGSSRCKVDAVLPRKVTCMLCQEEELLDHDAKPFVQAAFVQKTYFFSQKPGVTLKPATNGGAYFVSAGLECGVDASTCAHTMHAECYQQFSERMLSRDRTRARNQRVLATENGEFMCPLCKRLSNTAMPLLPALQLLNTKGFSENRAKEPEDFDEWVNRVSEELRAPPKITKKGHSRKRSHSERSLLDLAKNAEEKASSQPIGGLSSSVAATSDTSLSAPADHANRQHLQEDHGMNELAVREDIDRDEEEERDENVGVIRMQVLPPAPPGADELENNQPLPALRNALAVLENAEAGGRGLNNEQVAERIVDALLALVPGIDMEQNMNIFENEEQLGRLGEVVDLALEGAGGNAGNAVAERRGLQDVVQLLADGLGGQRGQPGRIIVEVQQQPAAQAAAPAAPQQPAQRPFSITNALSTFKSIVKERPKKRVIQQSLSKYEDTVLAFTRFIGQATKRDVETQRALSAVVVWQSTAQHIRELAVVLAIENKPLFGAFNTRQRDCLFAMARLSVAVAYSVQAFNELALRILNVLLTPPPPEISPRENSASPMQTEHQSTPPPPTSPTSTVSSSSFEGLPTSKRTNPLLFFQSPTSSSSGLKKEPPVNLLHVDILSLAVELAMAIGFTWNEGVVSLRGCKNEARELMADGSVDELHVIRLTLLAQLFQVFVTFEDRGTDDFEMMDDETVNKADSHPGLDKRIIVLRKMVRPDERLTNDVDGLRATLHKAVIEFLRPMALLYHAITLVPPPEALKDPFVDEFEPLCRYMGMPSHLADILDGPIIERLFKMWSAYVPQTQAGLATLVKQPVVPRQLIELPDDFADLINKVSKFRCPTIPVDESTPAVPTICLVCGEILCSQSYCCQKPKPGHRGVNSGNNCVGACNWHMESCTGPGGLFLRVRDCQIFLMTSKSRGCFKSAPYVDEFGEVDTGFRRGNPLHLNRDLYQKLKHLWLHQGIAEEVVNQYEIDQRNYAIDWDHF